MRKSLELRQERGALWDQAKKLLEKGAEMSAEDRQKYDGLMAEMDAKKADIDRLERAEKIEAELAPPTERQADSRLLRDVSSPELAAATRNYRRAFRGHTVGGKHPFDLLTPAHRDIVEMLHAAWNEAFRRAALNSASPEELALLKGNSPEFRDMGFGTGSEGGFLVPTGFMYELEIALKWYGDMLNVCTFIDTPTGNNLPWPTMNDTAQTGELVAENAQVTKQDLTIGQLIFYAWKYSTKMVPVSIELLQDSAFELGGVVKDAFAVRLGRILNTHFTTGLGQGSAQPNGIITAATAGPTAVGSGGNTGNADSNQTTLGSIDLIELEHSVDKAYRRGACFMAHDSTIKYVKEILDKYGRPLWLPGLASGDPDTINGYPYYTNNDMATLAASAKTVLFGQLNKYKVRRVRQLEVLTLRERFADFGQVAFIGFARFDGNLLDAGTHPVKYLVQHA